MKVKQIFIVLICLISCSQVGEYDMLESRIKKLSVQSDVTIYALGSNSCKSCKAVYLSYFLSNGLKGFLAIDTFKTKLHHSGRDAILHDKDEILSRVHIEGLANQRKIVLKEGKVLRVESITMENYREVMK